VALILSEQADGFARVLASNDLLNKLPIFQSLPAGEGCANVGAGSAKAIAAQPDSRSLLKLLLSRCRPGIEIFSLSAMYAVVQAVNSAWGTKFEVGDEVKIPEAPAGKK
jgi:hypothetical protein